MSAQHTPGPYFVFADEKGIFIATRDGETRLARMLAANGADLENAHLFGAAVELLEAALMAERLIDDMIRFVGQMALKDYALLNEAPIALRSAIAKARGQA